MDCGSQKSTGKPDIADIIVKGHATSLEGEYDHSFLVLCPVWTQPSQTKKPTLAD
jgi:hypothetical protein